MKEWGSRLSQIDEVTDADVYVQEGRQPSALIYDKMDDQSAKPPTISKVLPRAVKLNSGTSYHAVCSQPRHVGMQALLDTPCP